MEPKTPYRTPARLVRGSHFLHDAPFVRDRRTEVVRDVQRDGKMGHLLAAKGAYQQMAPPVYGSTWSHRGHGRVRWRGPKAKARYLDFQHEHRQSKPKNRKQMAAELVKAINELASSFRQADANADSTLTFDEFRELPLPKGQTEETARMWFETLDADNDGTVRASILHPYPITLARTHTHTSPPAHTGVDGGVLLLRHA